MADVLTRRQYLAAAIQRETGEWTAQRVRTLYAASPWAAHRNTCRKDLRALARHGDLTPQDAGGRRTYRPNTPKESAALRTIPARDLPPLAYAHSADHDPALTHPSKFRPVADKCWVKPTPRTGLWTSPVTGRTPTGDPADTAWLDWCRAEEYGSYTHLTEITPAPDARVLLIDTHADLAAIVDAYPAGQIVPGIDPDRFRYPDWVALAAAGWDAVYLTDEGQWATRLPPGGPDLYSWDCASVLWLRPAYTVGRTVAASATEATA